MPTNRTPVIEVIRANTHNLRDVSVSIPRGKLTVITGVSGSGKSSLAFDTLHVEGQRRYLESVTPFVRRFIDQHPRPLVEEITGLPPTLTVRQMAAAADSPRTIVATVTEILDYLRVLYARCGEPFCPQCGARIGSQTVAEILDQLERFPVDTKLHLLAPVIRGRKGEHREVFLRMKRDGFLRARVDGTLMLIDPPPVLDPTKVHDIELVVDRQIIRPGIRDRLAESVETAIRQGSGTCIAAVLDEMADWHDRVFNTRFACSTCELSFRDLEPRTFSFNSPYGACPTCDGLGTRADLDLALLIRDPKKSIVNGGLHLPGWETSKGQPTAAAKKQLSRWATDEDWLDCPVGQLPNEARGTLLGGRGGFAGLRAWANLSGTGAQSPTDLAEEAPGSSPFQAFLRELPCPDCNGERLAPAGRSVTLAGKSLPQLLKLTIREAVEFIKSLSDNTWGIASRARIADPLVAQVRERLAYLDRVGVGYLELDRPTNTLSGGEAQRVRLAAAVASGLNGVCYVLDEPSIGLHPRDTDRLLSILTELRDRGNTVIVVEHDEDTIRIADWIIDLGPGAGRLGGSIINAGSIKDFERGPGLTAEYLRGERRVTPRDTRASVDPSDSEVAQALKSRPSDGQDSAVEQTIMDDSRCLVLTDCWHHNLRGVSLRLPTGCLTAVTGVSGSGKSSLIIDCLVPLLRQRIANMSSHPAAKGLLKQTGGIGQVVLVDQSPIGRSSRSTPGTFTGALDHVRQLFAKSREAKLRGFNAGRFSFNGGEGVCTDCHGLGQRKWELSFLPDTFVICDTCRGQRFNRATLAVRYRGLHFADICAMPIGEAAVFFASHPRLRPILSTLSSVGLGHLTLGQSATTLSGGEAQRLKLANELATRTEGTALYVLDEPTTGLHLDDVAQLLGVLRGLTAQGHTVVVIEHHLDVIRWSDWVVDLGPEGGEGGGTIVGQGTPLQLTHVATSHTGQSLARHLAASR